MKGEKKVFLSSMQAKNGDFRFPISDFRAKRITVTGGKGFLGQHLIKTLKKHGCKYITVADRPEYNLTRIGDVKRMYR